MTSTFVLELVDSFDVVPALSSNSEVLTSSVVLQSSPLLPIKHWQDPAPRQRPWRLHVESIEHSAVQPSAYMSLAQGSPPPSAVLQSAPLHPVRHWQDPSPRQRPWRLHVKSIEHSGIFVASCPALIVEKE